MAMSVSAYADWVGENFFIQTPNEESLYQEHLLDTGNLRTKIEGFRNQLTWGEPLYGGVFRAEATGKWEQWFTTVLRDIYSRPRMQFVPVYFVDPSIPGLQELKLKNYEMATKCVYNSLWGNGSPVEIQVTNFLARLFRWDDFINRYACGINGRAFASNFIEYILRKTKLEFGTDRKGPIGRSKSLKSLFARTNSIDGFTLQNGLDMTGPLIIAKSDQHGRFHHDSWCGLSDGSAGKGNPKDSSREIEIFTVRPSTGLRSHRWVLKPVDRSVAFEAFCPATQEKCFVIVGQL